MHAVLTDWVNKTANGVDVFKGLAGSLTAGACATVPVLEIVASVASHSRSFRFQAFFQDQLEVKASI